MAVSLSRGFRLTGKSTAGNGLPVAADGIGGHVGQEGCPAAISYRASRRVISGCSGTVIVQRNQIGTVRFTEGVIAHNNPTVFIAKLQFAKVLVLGAGLNDEGASYPQWYRQYGVGMPADDHIRCPEQQRPAPGLRLHRRGTAVLPRVRPARAAMLPFRERFHAGLRR